MAKNTGIKSPTGCPSDICVWVNDATTTPTKAIMEPEERSIPVVIYGKGYSDRDDADDGDLADNSW